MSIRRNVHRGLTRPGRGFRLILMFILLGTSGSPVRAQEGLLSLSWGTCSPVVADISSTAPSPFNLIVSAVGVGGTHEFYVVRCVLGTPSNTVPDAWRFDLAGCQPPYDGGLVVSSMPPASVAKTCPPFKGLGSALDQHNYFFSSTFDIPSSLIEMEFWSIYPAGNTTSADQRYHLAHFRFDHQRSVAGPGTPGVTCGGFENPMIFTLRYRSGGQIPTDVLLSKFRRPGATVDTVFGLSDDFMVFVNGELPAAPSTWGQVKSVYRR